MVVVTGSVIVEVTVVVVELTGIGLAVVVVVVTGSVIVEVTVVAVEMTGI